MSTQRFDHPFFARVWTMKSAKESQALRDLRQENLAGLSGRVLEVGAGTGTNFGFYPDTVREVLALEPEPRLFARASHAATSATVPVTVVPSAIETLSAAEPFDAVVCALVLCSVDDLGRALRQINSVLTDGGELRYLEHVASSGWPGRLQRLAEATVWPQLSGNCHPHRDTERAIRDAGFTIDTARHEWVPIPTPLPAWMPAPSSEFALGRATKTEQSTT
jgi:SAM-dependent methyltransferase